MDMSQQGSRSVQCTRTSTLVITTLYCPFLPAVLFYTSCVTTKKKFHITTSTVHMCRTQRLESTGSSTDMTADMTTTASISLNKF